MTTAADAFPSTGADPVPPAAAGTTCTVRIWRGERGTGAFQDYKTEVRQLLRLRQLAAVDQSAAAVRDAMDRVFIPARDG